MPNLLRAILLEASFKSWQRRPGNSWQNRYTFRRECPICVAGIIQRT